jgi:hypothetical protein
MNGYGFTFNEDAKGQSFRGALDRLRGDKVFRSQIERKVGQGGGGEWGGALDTLRSQERSGELQKARSRLSGLREEEELEDIQGLISKKTSPSYQGLRKAGMEEEEEAMRGSLSEILSRQKLRKSGMAAFSPISQSSAISQNQQSGGIIGGSMNRMFA